MWSCDKCHKVIDNKEALKYYITYGDPHCNIDWIVCEECYAKQFGIEAVYEARRYVENDYDKAAVYA
jgi:hypothetical protein